MIDSLVQDIRFGVRGLAARPGFTAIALLALALGIGANTAVFSLIHAVLLQPLPFRDGDQLVSLDTTHEDGTRQSYSILDFEDVRERNRVFDGIAGFAGFSATLTGNGEPVRLQGVGFSAGFFEVLGTRAAVGRVPLPEDERPTSSASLLLTDALWRRCFGADPNILGKQLVINGQSREVIGVLPPDFILPGGAQAELLTPLVLETDPRRPSRAAGFLRVVARLASGVTIERAAAGVNEIARQLHDEYPQTNAGITGAALEPLRETLVGKVRPMLLVLQVAIVLVLLIACANLGSLLLARVAARQQELAVRAALGASRRLLVQQLLVESLILAIGGGALGVLLAWWGIPVLLTLGPENLPRAKGAAVHGPVLLFTFGLSVFAAILFGLIPALQASAAAPNAALRGSGRGLTDAKGQARTRRLLVVAEVALSLMLLAGAGLLLQSFRRLQEVDPGFRADHLLTMRLSLSKTRYSSADQIQNLYGQLAPRIERIPGVQSVGLSSVLPMQTWRASIDFSVVGRPDLTPDGVAMAYYRVTSPTYFRTMGIPLVKGRELADSDTGKSVPVILINQSLAQRVFGHQDPLGERLQIDDVQGKREVQIVGVVGDIKHYGLDDAPTMDVYVPLPQAPKDVVVWLVNSIGLAVRTGVEPLSVADAVKRELHAVDPDVPASSVQTMEQALRNVNAPRRFNLLLLQLFAAVALLLTVSGIYGVTAYTAAQRRREIGVRVALGAGRANILRLVVGHGLRPVLTGLLLGLAGAVALSRLISSLLFQTSPTDPFTLAGVSALLVLVSFLAAYVPASRATAVDPVSALRAE